VGQFGFPPAGAYIDGVGSIRCYRDYTEMIDRVLEARVGEVTIAVGRDVLQHALREIPRVVVIANHGPPHVPLVGMCAVGRCMNELGHGDRRPLSIAFRAFYRVPGIRQFFARLTQLPEPLPFEGILQHFETQGFTDLCVIPEGQNCVFGHPGDIRQFTSPRFVEMAARLDVPILVAVGVGMEPWAREVPLPDLSSVEPAVRWVSPSLADSLHVERSLCLPVSFEKVPELRYGFELHRAGLRPADLLALDARARRAAVSREAARLHAAMERLRDRVREGARTVPPVPATTPMAP